MSEIIGKIMLFVRKKVVFEIISKVLLFGLLVIVMAVLAALPTMLLWNGLMPDIFGLSTIGFIQALGLNLLATVLFKPGTSSSGKK